MSALEFTIRPEGPDDAITMAHVAARAIGPGRFARTAYRIREGVRPAEGLSLVAELEGRVAGAIRFTEVAIGGERGGLLLGPLVVVPELVGRGCGRRLIEAGLDRARARGHHLVLLVGDLAYYERSGFAPCPPGRIALPGPVDPARLLVAELTPGASGRYSGLVTGAGATL